MIIVLSKWEFFDIFFETFSIFAFVITVIQSAFTAFDK